MGAMMIFELSELLRDSITEINDEVLGKIDEIEKKNDVMQQETLGQHTSNINNLSYTPVTAETFAVWCE